MNKILHFTKTNKLLVVIMLVYISLLILAPGKGIQSLQNSLYYIKEMVTIMPVILLLTALITAWVPKEAIEKNLGTNSGIRGSIFSFLLGSFSAGPIYAAFPVCKTLLSKGASISNIVILLSTWAVVKVPMLLNEAKFLSPRFMAIRWVLTTVAIFLMGYITSKLVKIEDLPAGDPLYIQKNKENVLSIAQEYCIGCGLCQEMAPEYFVLANKKVNLLRPDINEGDREKINATIEKCPAKIIGLS